MPSLPDLPADRRDHFADVLADYERLKQSRASIGPQEPTHSNSIQMLKTAIEETRVAHQRLLDREQMSLEEANKHLEFYRRSLQGAAEAEETASIMKRQYNELKSLLEQLEERQRQTSSGTGESSEQSASPNEINGVESAEAKLEASSQSALSAPGFDESTPPDPVPAVEEDPPSPPTSRMALSPPPLQNRRHAGHTPGIPAALSNQATPGQETPRASQQSSTEEQDVLPEECGEGEVILRGPLSLTPDPSHNHTPLDMLHKTLEEVQRDPEAAKPAAIQAAEELDSILNSQQEGQKQSLEENQKPQQGVQTHCENEENSKDEEPIDDGMPVLKTKASLNFGIPFGELGYYGRRRSGYEEEGEYQ